MNKQNQSSIETYNNWEIHPELAQKVSTRTSTENVIWKRLSTKHEGDVLYWKLWNFWVRSGTKADQRSTSFFRDYETANEDTDKLLESVGFEWRKAETEKEVWNRIGDVWAWLKSNVTYDSDAYNTITSLENSWPSILDFGKFYRQNGRLVWAACFSKAHLFATLLGRLVYPRYRFAIATAHHTENGAPATASHVYVAAYVKERWFYFDPTAVYQSEFPSFEMCKSIGVENFQSVDYQHPFKLIPVPLSGFNRVPYLPA